MTFNFETSSPPFVRKYQQIDDHTGKVSLGEIEAFVEHDPFWLKFAQGWEPETERIYRKLVSPGSTVLDIGAWIGSTILFALACGAEKIVAMEPNPGSNKTIRQFINMNPLLSKRIFLTSRAISDKEETLTMGLAENESDTSTSGIGGNDFEVEATTLSIIRSEYDLTQLDLVKIDIEGAEVFLTSALRSLANIPGQFVHLSIHVSFFPKDADRTSFIESLKDFEIYDDRGQNLDFDEFENRILSSETHPSWGTKHGNFFEVLLIAH
jgi:FkbM family methyltransferase